MGKVTASREVKLPASLAPMVKVLPAASVTTTVAPERPKQSSACLVPVKTVPAMV